MGYVDGTTYVAKVMIMTGAVRPGRLGAHKDPWKGSIASIGLDEPSCWG